MTFAEALHSQFSLMQYLDFGLRILLAGLCGGFIGYERSRRYKEAGVRTHIIVCFASALIMLVSKYGFLDITENIAGLNITGGTADSARIAAQVISGISFLGTGVIIFKNGNTIRGLTTAAGLWATAGIGLAFGAGMYYIGLFSTVLFLILQLVMHKFLFGADLFSKTQTLNFTFAKADGLNERLTDYLTERKFQILEREVLYDNENHVSYNLRIRSNKILDLEDMMAYLSEFTEIESAGCSSSVI